MTSAILGDVDSSVHEKIEEKSDSDENITNNSFGGIKTKKNLEYQRNSEENEHHLYEFIIDATY